MPVLVDDADYGAVSVYAWRGEPEVSVDGNILTWYAVRTKTLNGHGKKRRRTTVRMHRQILAVPAGTEVDHADGNGLNNQRSNIRVCSHAQNGQNRRKLRGKSSRFKGVSWHKPSLTWQAYIGVKGHHKHLGRFTSEVAAAAAYNCAAKTIFKKFSKLNLCPR